MRAAGAGTVLWRSNMWGLRFSGIFTRAEIIAWTCASSRGYCNSPNLCVYTFREQMSQILFLFPRVSKEYL